MECGGIVAKHQVQHLPFAVIVMPAITHFIGRFGNSFERRDIHIDVGSVTAPHAGIFHSTHRWQLMALALG